MGSLHGFYLMVLRKSFYIHWSAGRSPRVHEVNPGRDPSHSPQRTNSFLLCMALVHQDEGTFASVKAFTTAINGFIVVNTFSLQMIIILSSDLSHLTSKCNDFGLYRKLKESKIYLYQAWCHWSPLGRLKIHKY